jgi:hypothetical protein
MKGRRARLVRTGRKQPPEDAEGRDSGKGSARSTPFLDSLSIEADEEVQGGGQSATSIHITEHSLREAIEDGALFLSLAPLGP